MKRIVGVWIVIAILFFEILASAAEVKVPFDYYSRGVEAYAKATNGSVTVNAGQYGLIQCTIEDDTVHDIKDACNEDIYFLKWIDNQFVAFSKNYKMTSLDGYTWVTEENSDLNERKLYGVQSEKTQRIDVMWMNNTVEMNKYVDYMVYSEKPPIVNIVYTGKEYIKTEDYHKKGRVAFDRKLYVSSDRENWTYVKTFDGEEYNKYEKQMFLGNSSDINVQIINTGKEYLVRPKEMDYTINPYDIKQPILVYDLEYNYVKSISMDDYIVDMSYVDGVYYLTTNKNITYQSTDLEKWEVFGEEIGVPLNNGTKTLYKTHIPLNKDVLWDGISLCYYEGPILEENGNPSQNVVLENIELYGMRAVGDFFVAFSKAGKTADQYTDDNNIKGLDRQPLDIKRFYTKQPTRVYFSKDGVYWGAQALAYNEPITTISQSEKSLIIEAANNGRIFNIKFSDLENVIPKSDLYIQLNNRILGFSTPPVMEDDRTLVPMRFLFEQMGTEVSWDEAAQTATATVPVSQDAQLRTFGAETAKSVTFAIDNTTATVNGATATMDVPARLVNDKTMVPLRFLSENLGYTVEWDEATNTAIITTN